MPLGRDQTLPLAFDAGETPFRLVDLSFDGDRKSMEARFRYLGEKPATAWSVRLAQVSSAGTELSASTHTVDWSQSIESGDGILEKLATRLVHQGGLLLPGQEVVSDVGAPSPAPRSSETSTETARLVLSIPVVVFNDMSFAGSARLARGILGERRAAVEELAYWSARLEELVEHAATQAEAVAGVEALLADLSADASHLPHAAQAVRSNFRSNLAGVLSVQDLRPKTAIFELRSLAEWVRGQLEEDARHAPRELPEIPESQGEESRLRSPVIGDGDDRENCECGGRISVSSSQHQTRNCDGSDTGWRVDESWSYACLNDSNFTETTGTDVLNGVGGCIEDAFCFADRYCPPVFSGPVSSEDNDFHYWERAVMNQRLVVGFCTSRCDSLLLDSVSFKCLCSPPPAPGCDTHGCPILIETGAGGFRLTGLDQGVLFDIDADGEAERVSWPVPATDDAWLALDRDGNGAIDSGAELFGDSTPQPESGEPNGFLALAVFDRPEAGGDGDGQITAADAVFGDLLLWVDGDHDGVSSPSELTSLAAAGIVALELEYHESRRSDRHGNEFRYFAGVWHDSGARRLAQDVFLLHD